MFVPMHSDAEVAAILGAEKVAAEAWRLLEADRELLHSAKSEATSLPRTSEPRLSSHTKLHLAPGSDNIALQASSKSIRRHLAAFDPNECVIARAIGVSAC